MSVIIMSYNFSAFIGEAIESVLQQKDVNDFEIIVIDDASTDASAEIARRYAGTRVKVVCHQTNQGFVRSANEGFALARGKYVARLDGDDRYRADLLATTSEILDRYPDVGMVYGDAATIDKTGRIIEEKSTRVTPWITHNARDFKGNQYLPLIFDNCIPAPTVLARREAWDRALPIPENFAFIDWYTNLRIARHYDIYYVARTLADYRIHDSNAHRNFPRNRSYEETVLSVLDQLFAEDDYLAEKARIRATAYSEAFSNFARRYQTWGMSADARRCAVRAFLEKPFTAYGISMKIFLRSWMNSRAD